MKLDFNGEVPIYVQLGEEIKDGILTGVYEEGAQIPSTTEISLTYKINPATVGKGYNLLVDEGVIYKKRGVGMFVADGAVEKLREVRRGQFFTHYVQSMLREAERLELGKEEIMQMIEEAEENE